MLAIGEGVVAAASFRFATSTIRYRRRHGLASHTHGRQRERSKTFGEFQCAPACHLGVAIVAALLQPERMRRAKPTLLSPACQYGSTWARRSARARLTSGLLPEMGKLYCQRVRAAYSITISPYRCTARSKSPSSRTAPQLCIRSRAFARRPSVSTASTWRKSCARRLLRGYRHEVFVKRVPHDKVGVLRGAGLDHRKRVPEIAV